MDSERVVDTFPNLTWTEPETHAGVCWTKTCPQKCTLAEKAPIGLGSTFCGKGMKKGKWEESKRESARNYKIKGVGQWQAPAPAGRGEREGAALCVCHLQKRVPWGQKGRRLLEKPSGVEDGLLRCGVKSPSVETSEDICDKSLLETALS